MSASKLPRVYVAGAYSGPDVMSILGNVRRGIQASIAVRQAGFSPYVPWCDILLHAQAEFSLEDSYSQAMAWLEAADAVLVVPEGASESKGTQAEIRRAEELGIPIYDLPTVEKSIEAMRDDFEDQE